jgi:hypothetical protein
MKNNAVIGFRWPINLSLAPSGSQMKRMTYVKRTFKLRTYASGSFLGAQAKAQQREK